MVDTDGGIDDALAIILALRSPEVELVGLTAVSGNVIVEQATLNVLRVVELLDRRDVWVARGLGNPLVRDPIRATAFHGIDGLGDSNLPPPRLRARSHTAHDALIEQLNLEKNRDLTVVAIGPLTNIAALITKEPNASKQIKELVIMGGAYGLTQYGYGNETPVAEFNVYSDPEAAKIVFESGIPIRAVGLDITSSPDTWLMQADYNRIRTVRTRVATFTARILAKPMRDRRKFELHDPIAVGAAIQPALYKFEEYGVRVETKGEYTTGMTATDRRPQARDQWPLNAMICTNLKAQRFKRFFLGHILKD